MPGAGWAKGDFTENVTFQARSLAPRAGDRRTCGQSLGGSGYRSGPSALRTSEIANHRCRIRDVITHRYTSIGRLPKDAIGGQAVAQNG